MEFLSFLQSKQRCPQRRGRPLQHKYRHHRRDIAGLHGKQRLRLCKLYTGDEERQRRVERYSTHSLPESEREISEVLGKAIWGNLLPVAPGMEPATAFR